MCIDSRIYFNPEKDEHKPFMYKHKKYERCVLNYKLVILSNGKYPTAYVGFKDCIIYELYRSAEYHDNIDYLINNYINVHGGFTYEGEGVDVEMRKDEYYYIGWDYAHMGDYINSDISFDQTSIVKYWTLEEIESEQFYVLYNLIYLNYKLTYLIDI